MKSRWGMQQRTATQSVVSVRLVHYVLDVGVLGKQGTQLGCPRGLLSLWLVQQPAVIELL